MLTLHPTLLIGPSDWQTERMPKDEFASRLDALWRHFPSAARAVVYGNSRHHAELAYLTNLVPKLEAAVAIISRTGEHRLFLGGGPNMVGAARPLTFVSDLLPLRGGKAIGQASAKGLDGRAGEILTIGAGYMPSPFRQSMVEAIGGCEPAADAIAPLWALMRRKSARELAVIREACNLLRIAIAAIDQARRTGASVTASVLAGERAANLEGAQDVRTLFSIDAGRTLRPFTALSDEAVDPLQVYVAVRRFNYWAEGFAVLSNKAAPHVKRASDALRMTLGAIKVGAAASDVAKLVTDAIHPHRAHPVTEHASIADMGIALYEPPYTDVGGTFEAGEVCSLRVGVTDGAEHHAIVSAMVAVRHDGNDVLWMGS